jgi:hypothetical protein
MLRSTITGHLPHSALELCRTMKLQTFAKQLGEYLQVDPVKNFQKITISLSR